MIIKGRRRGIPKDLANHLNRTDENEYVKILQLEGFAFDTANPVNLERALKQMEAIGLAKGIDRNLFHVMLCPNYGETLTAKQRDFMVNYYLAHMGFEKHQYALVEHLKNGRQHFHLVVNMTNPETGKTHELKWYKNKHWRISRGLEGILGLKSPKPYGKEQPTWAVQRSKSSGIDPMEIRQKVTAAYQSCRTAKEFVAALDKTGLALTTGRKGQLVLVDKAGDTHGLMRMIEGKQTIADLRQKFEGIEQGAFVAHAKLVRERKKNAPKLPKAANAILTRQLKQNVAHAYKASKSGVEFFARLNRKECSFGRGFTGFVLIDKGGGRHSLAEFIGKEKADNICKRFPDLAALKPSPATEIIRRIRMKLPTAKYRHPNARPRGIFQRSASTYTRPSYWPQPYGLAGLFLHHYRPEKKDDQPPFVPLPRTKKRYEDEEPPKRVFFNMRDIENARLLRWAWENHRLDILRDFGIILPPDYFDLS